MLHHIGSPLRIFESLGASGMWHVIFPSEIQEITLATHEKSVDGLHFRLELPDVKGRERHDCKSVMDVRLLFSPRDGVYGVLNANIASNFVTCSRISGNEKVK